MTVERFLTKLQLKTGNKKNHFVISAFSSYLLQKMAISAKIMAQK